MITELTITPEYGDSLNLSVPGPSNGYLVKEIEGLDPVPVAHSSSTVTTLPGEIRQASRLEKRNIILKIKLVTNYALETVSTRRARLYELGLGRQNLTLSFTSSEYGSVDINGYVEEFDAPTSTDDPLVTISIICFDPIFRGVESEPILDVISETSRTLIYDGTSPGYVEIHFQTPTAIVHGLSLSFTHADSRITGVVDLDSNFPTTTANGWSFSSQPGNKHLRRETEGTSSLSIVDFSSLIWPVLLKGENTYTIQSKTPGEDWMEYTLSWVNLYGAL